MLVLEPMCPFSSNEELAPAEKGWRLGETNACIQAKPHRPQLLARLRVLLAKGSIASDCSTQLRDEDQACDEFLVPRRFHGCREAPA